MYLRIMLIPIGALALAGAGCATEGPSPKAELSRAHTLVEQADKAGAQSYAAADLQRAHDELTAADTADTAHKYDVARSYAESAAVDADLATARSQAGEAQKAAREVNKGNDSLRTEADRAADATMAPPAPAVVTKPN